MVVALASWNELFDKLMSNVKEVKARGADVIGIATESHRAALAALVDSALSIPDTHPMFLPFPGGHPHAAVRLLCGPHAGVRHRQAPQPGQERHRGVMRTFQNKSKARRLLMQTAGLGLLKNLC